MDLELESKIISDVNQIIWSMCYPDFVDETDKFRDSIEDQERIEQHSIIQMITLVRSLDFESQPTPESQLTSLIVQTKSLLNSVDMDSQANPSSEVVISWITQSMNSVYEDVLDHFYKEPSALERELKSLIFQILSLVKYEDHIFIRLQAEVMLGDDNIIHIVNDLRFMRDRSEYENWSCLSLKVEKFKMAREGTSTYVFCEVCNGYSHEKGINEIKHPFHPKHSLQLLYLKETYGRSRKCFCCDDDLKDLICCCFACDFALNMVCAKKPRVLSIHHPKWHQHPLALFSRTTSLICDVCALVADSTCPIYICPPCGFVVHQTCISLPRVIRMSRHPQHRISFTPSFNQENLSCGVCRKEIHSDYGGYSCTKNDCSYAAHSKCATQRNVWDGVDLEGVPEEDIEDVEPFLRISDGVIQHFSHEDHHLKLDENIKRDYDDNKLCQACITPIYFGNLYACTQCDFILHEECANLRRKMYHPIHPHMLTLEHDYDSCKDIIECSACPSFCTSGLSYNCRGCEFQLHVSCAVISEPLVHASHMHPLFLTSKPGEWRKCSICKESRNRSITNETFNCIECDFSLCFSCATIPHKVRYKHDKHMFVLSYAKESSMMVSWCEACEEKIDTLCHLAYRMYDWEEFIHEAWFSVVLPP